MNLADEFNLSVINNIEMRKNFAPTLITQFMSDYDDLNRNFIEYKLGPRINSLIRRERFDIVYDLLFKRNSESESAELLRTIESCYLDGKNMVDIICNNISVEDHDTYVVANLDTMQFNDNFSEVVKNYTGLIANRIASRYNKLALVLCTDAIESYKGSVRDPYSRQALRLFERFISCGGHMSAFGVRVLKKDYKSASRQLELLSHRLKTGIQESQIELDGEEFDDRLIYQLRVIADYNEVSGNTLPKAVIRKRVGNTLKVTREEKYSKVKWGDATIIVFNNVYIGDTLIITPTISKNSITCFGVHATK
jgi:single-stranded DNA-specific DHH superfamily exonuclease